MDAFISLIPGDAGGGPLLTDEYIQESGGDFYEKEDSSGVYVQEG